jgi:hypothetical protein
MYRDYSPTRQIWKPRSKLPSLPLQVIQTRELMSWIDRAMLLSKFKLHPQGSYQTDWQVILKATNPNKVGDANYYREQVRFV